jgi:hypothetical protein
LKTNAPWKTAAEKVREREQQPENKAKKRAYNQMYNERDDVKENRREYKQRDDVKAKKREYEQRDDVKEKRREREQRDDVKENRREREQQPEKKEKKSAYNQEYNQRPDVKENRREYNQKPENKLKRKEREQKYRKRRKIEHIKQQLKFPPPLGFNAPCATCPREKSRGWMRAIKAHKLLSKKFDEKGLIGYLPLDKSYNILNIKKRAAKGEGCPKLNQNDVFCLGCWTTTQVEADNKIAKVLAERNKNEQLMK